MGDFRKPDAMRFGFAPLYLRFVEIYDAVAVMEEVFEHEAWRDLEPAGAGAVT